MSEAISTSEEIVVDPYSIPLDGNFNVAQAHLFEQNALWSYFERLRKEAPVHFCEESEFGPYWSITRFEDIMHVDTNHKVFSSEGGITLADQDEDFILPMFIAMDPPKHDDQRKVVSPVVAPINLVKLESTIRTRAAALLDALPVGEEIDWVDRISIELTTQMLATLFDFPFEQRRKLTRWSDVATANLELGIVDSEDQRR
jgi:cytochrome P450